MDSHLLPEHDLLLGVCFQDLDSLFDFVLFLFVNRREKLLNHSVLPILHSSVSFLFVLLVVSIIDV